MTASATHAFRRTPGSVRARVLFGLGALAAIGTFACGEPGVELPATGVVIEEGSSDDVPDVVVRGYSLRVRRVLYRSPMGIPSEFGSGRTQETIEFIVLPYPVDQASYPLVRVGDRTVWSQAWTPIEWYALVEYRPDLLEDGAEVIFGFGTVTVHGAELRGGAPSGFHLDKASLKTYRR